MDSNPLGATRRDGLGATNLRDTTDYGFEWLDKTRKYNWEASRREEFSATKRDNLADWDTLGATVRDDRGDPRRDHLGKTVRENLGATRRVDIGTTGDTRRDFLGVSTNNVGRSTAAYKTPNHDDLELTAQQPTPPPGYDYTYTRDIKRSTRAENPRHWASIAADRDLMNGWHSMFGQVGV